VSSPVFFVWLSNAQIYGGYSDSPRLEDERLRSNKQYNNNITTALFIYIYIHSYRDIYYIYTDKTHYSYPNGFVRRNELGRCALIIIIIIWLYSAVRIMHDYRYRFHVSHVLLTIAYTYAILLLYYYYYYSKSTNITFLQTVFGVHSVDGIVLYRRKRRPASWTRYIFFNFSYHHFTKSENNVINDAIE